MNNDLDSLNGQFDALQSRADAFSRLLENQVGHALDALVVKGASLQSVMGSLYQNLLTVATQLAVINPALNTVFGSNRSTLDSAGGSGILGGVTTGLEGVFGSLFGSGSASAAPAASASGSPVTVNIQTANAQSFTASSAQVSAAIADAVRRGQTLR